MFHNFLGYFPLFALFRIITPAGFRNAVVGTALSVCLIPGKGFDITVFLKPCEGGVQRRLFDNVFFVGLLSDML